MPFPSPVSPRFSIRRKILLGFGLVFVMLGIIGVISYRSTRAFILNADWVAHTREVMEIEERTQRVSDYEAFKNVMEGRPGFVIAPWCGSAACEAQIKTDTQATIRNMPMTAATPSGRCVRCDLPAQAEAWFAKSY